MAFQKQEKLALKIRQIAINAAKTLGLSMNFPKGRRQSDMLLIKLSGKREQVCAVLNRIVTIFPEIDVNILKINPKDTPYNFILVVTRKLDEQNMASNERRSKLIASFTKLKRDLQSLSKKPLPQDFNDVIFLENL